MGLESEQQMNNDDLGQHQDDALLPRPELPPRMTATVQRSSPPYVSNQNLFRVLLKNKRQITSLTAGLCVLFFFHSDIIIIHQTFRKRNSCVKLFLFFSLFFRLIYTFFDYSSSNFFQ